MCGTRFEWDTGILSFTLSNLTHTDGIYHAAFLRTIAYVVGATFLCLVIGYPFAYFLARHAGRAKGWFLALFFAPFWFSYMLRMLAWIGLLQDQGYVNRVLQDVGVLGAPYPFLSGKSWVLVTGLVYGYVPYMVLPLYAALDRLPAAQLEAARDLGASPTRTFFRVTLPQTRQAILAGVIIAGLPMFGDYFTQQLLANTVGTRMIGNFIIDSLDVPIFVSRGFGAHPRADGAPDRPDRLLPAEHGPGGTGARDVSARASGNRVQAPPRPDGQPWARPRFLWVIGIAYVDVDACPGLDGRPVLVQQHQIDLAVGGVLDALVCGRPQRVRCCTTRICDTRCCRA